MGGGRMMKDDKYTAASRRVKWRFQDRKGPAPPLEDEFAVVDADSRLKRLRVWAAALFGHVDFPVPAYVVESTDLEKRDHMYGFGFLFGESDRARSFRASVKDYYRIVALAEVGDKESIRELRRMMFE